MRVIDPPENWVHRCDCLVCKSVLEIEEADVFTTSANTSTDSDKFYIKCPRCNAPNLLRDEPVSIPKYIKLRVLNKNKCIPFGYY